MPRAPKMELSLSFFSMRILSRGSLVWRHTLKYNKLLRMFVFSWKNWAWKALLSIGLTYAWFNMGIVMGEPPGDGAIWRWSFGESFRRIEGTKTFEIGGGQHCWYELYSQFDRLLEQQFMVHSLVVYLLIFSRVYAFKPRNVTNGLMDLGPDFKNLIGLFAEGKKTNL